jgi:uncharacterized protein YuzE
VTQLATIAPQLVSELATGLLAEGRPDLAKQLESAEIGQCRYDESVDAGYIYLVRPAPSWYYEKLSAPVKETTSWDIESGLNVDADHDGNLFGIEFLGRADIVATLRDKNAL